METTRRSAIIAAAVLTVLLGQGAAAFASGPYFPPNPPPQYVEPGSGEYGHFPLPGLYLGFSEPGQPPTVERRIKVVDDIPESIGSSVLSPPLADGQPDAYLDAWVKDLDPDHPFAGIATITVTLCVKAMGIEEVCHPYTLKLYVGVPIPDTGAATDVLVKVSATVLLLGGGLVVLARPRRRLMTR